ncbi:MAG: type IVB secretion system protein IcmH/DotU [Pseudomonadota bacterium]
MSNNDPFAEPDDADRTVIKPNLGGRRASPAAQPAAAPAPNFDPLANPMAPQQPAGGAAPAADPSAYGMPQQAMPQAVPGGNTAPGEPNVEAGMTGMNRLNAAAATLFSLVSRIRNRAQHMDPDKLRRSVIAEVRGFENRCLQAGIEAQEVKIARYAICATLDDVVLNTPWGSQSSWAMQSMVGTFHKETVGGDRFYDLLARLEKEPGKNIDLLEFMYMCLSLGFEGRLRVEPNGIDRHMQIRAGLARIVRGQRGPWERDLSPHWKGVDLPHKVLSIWKPVWLTTATVAILLTITFLGLSYLLNRDGEHVLGQMSVLDTGVVATLKRVAPEPIPPALPPSASLTAGGQTEGETPREPLLEDEVAEGLVEVIEDVTKVTVRVSGRAMFASASDQLQPEYQDLVDRVAEELATVSGQIVVVGHSDNIPIRSSRFPSNMHLSLARAEAVMARMAPVLDAGAEAQRADAQQLTQDNASTGELLVSAPQQTLGASRMKAEGRADKEPIASNDTPEGRAKNRRIEIILVKEDAT